VVMPSCADRWRRERKYFFQLSEKAFHMHGTRLRCTLNIQFNSILAQSLVRRGFNRDPTSRNNRGHVNHKEDIGPESLAS
jgi:hypothetical protein